MRNKKRTIILSLVIVIIIAISLVLVFNKNILNKLRGDTSGEAYEQAGFGSKVIYKCVIDTYGHGKTVDDVLTDEELSEIGIINCLIPEENKNDIIDLKGYEKLNSSMFRIGNEINELNMNNFINSDGGNQYFYIEKTPNSNIIINKFNIENNNINIKLRLQNINMINTLNIKNNIFTNGSIVGLGSSSSVVNNAYIENNSGITSLTLHGDANSQNLSVSNNPDLETVMISGFKNIVNIDFTNIINLKALTFTGSNLETLDLSNNVNLTGRLILQGNKLTDVQLPDNVTITQILLNNNKLKEINIPSNTIVTNLLRLDGNEFNKIDLSNNNNIVRVNLSNNKFGDNFKYLVKGKSINIKDIINLPGDTTYNYHDAVIEIDNHVLTPRSEGETSFSIVNGILANNLDFDINVYDITSNEYTIDKDKKEIVYKDNFDVNKIKVTDGYTLNVDGDNLIINKEEDHADTFKLVKDVPKTTKKTTTKKNETTKNSSKEESKNLNNAGKSVIKNTQKRVIYKDIYLKDNYVSSTYLNKINGYNRNIILDNDDVTFKINGLDNIDIIDDIDLSYTLVDITSYNDDKIKKDIDKGYILKFNNENKLSYKVLAEIKYDKVKEKVDNKNIKVYKYKDGKYTLIGDNLDVVNNKISCYIRDTSLYIITNKRIDNAVKSNLKSNNSIITKEDTRPNESIEKQKNKLIIILSVTIISIILVIISIIKLVKRKKEYE